MQHYDLVWCLQKGLEVLAHQGAAKSDETNRLVSGWYIRLPAFDGRTFKVSIEDVTGEAMKESGR